MPLSECLSGDERVHKHLSAANHLSDQGSAWGTQPPLPWPTLFPATVGWVTSPQALVCLFCFVCSSHVPTFSTGSEPKRCPEHQINIPRKQWRQGCHCPDHLPTRQLMLEGALQDSMMSWHSAGSSHSTVSSIPHP